MTQTLHMGTTELTNCIRTLEGQLIDRTNKVLQNTNVLREFQQFKREQL